MERGKGQGTRAREFRDLLAGEKLAEINFDDLIGWLNEVAPLLEGRQAQADDLKLLRQDYEGRIAGMVKALAAVDRSGRGHGDVILSLEELPRLSTSKLIECYRKTAARFRDAFPASYGLAYQSKARVKSARFDDYK